jgi:monofunctional biosynthetic peptidoglycan transglycosylase
MVARKMARPSKTKSSKTKRKPAKNTGGDPVRAALRVGTSPLRWVRRWVLRGVLAGVVLSGLWVLAYAVINPPTTPYILSEKRRLGAVDRMWVPFEAVAPVMARSVVAAEDANFCTHWGFDMDAIRAALEDGARRGASTISQQVVKNAYLWHGRDWSRKALEALITPAVEAAWSKRRILEVYLNIVEFDEGVFGVEAAARHYFGVGPEALSAVQAARLAAVLPNPKARSAARPGGFVRRRADGIMDGAETIRRDGRAACFED